MNMCPCSYPSINIHLCRMECDGYTKLLDVHVPGQMQDIWRTGCHIHYPLLNYLYKLILNSSSQIESDHTSKNLMLT